MDNLTYEQLDRYAGLARSAQYSVEDISEIMGDAYPDNGGYMTTDKWADAERIASQLVETAQFLAAEISRLRSGHDMGGI